MISTTKEQMLLSDVPEEFVFRCHDGSIFRNMKDLADGLATMSDETYAFHVNSKNNDFANWVRDIIKDDRLVRDLTSASNRRHAAMRAASRVSTLSKK